MDQGLRFRLFEVEQQAALASVQCVVGLALAGREPADAADTLALGRLDLDDIGAEVGEVQPAVGPCNDLCEFEYFDSSQWSGHGSALPSVRSVVAAHITPVVSIVSPEHERSTEVARV